MSCEYNKPNFNYGFSDWLLIFFTVYLLLFGGCDSMLNKTYEKTDYNNNLIWRMEQQQESMRKDIKQIKEQQNIEFQYFVIKTNNIN